MKTLTLFILLIMLGACSRTKNVAPVETLDGQALNTGWITCAGQDDFLKNVTGQVGRVWYNTAWGAYTILVPIPGTFDAQDVGVVCNMPQELKVNGLSVIFDGEYRKYEKPSVGLPAGQKVYYLVLKKVTYTP